MADIVVGRTSASMIADDVRAETSSTPVVVPSQSSRPNVEYHSARNGGTPSVDLVALQPVTGTTTSASPEVLDFHDLDLICPIDADEISNRWLRPFIPSPGQTPKIYSAAVTSFIRRMLKSYTTAMVRGHSLPPFVHAAQSRESCRASPLAAASLLVRTCQNLHPGSENIAVGILQREMDRLHQEHLAYDQMMLLAAFQAYLIYTMVMFFLLKADSDSFVRQAMMNLQDIACASSRGGLICRPDQQGTKPRWEEWIVTEAKRRTLYAMYLFDSLLSAQDNLPTFLGTELEGLPAPMSKNLWRSQSRQEWDLEYNRLLVQVPSSDLQIEELWPTPAFLSPFQLNERNARTEAWLETVDEFGAILFAVTTCTHGN